MRKFEFRTWYKANYKEQIKFGPIKKQELWSFFTDGRVMGLLNEKLLTSLFNNISPAPSNNSSYDVVIDGKHKCEVRSVTKDVKLIPSKQIGTGRQYDEKAYKEKRKCLYAYIFVDVIDSPEFSIVGILESQIPSKKGFSRNSFLKMITDLKPKKVVL